MAATNIAEKLNLREGTNKHKFGTFMLKNKGKPVKVDAAVKAVYGKATPKARGAFGMVLNGFKASLEAKKAGKIERDSKADTITLR